ncbi:MAG: hypothetical protein ACRBB0_08925 [Pelagimonas sp.]|uniref:hypothetical protein n=1 Tax=Pelagimonas sp. TaxID=2073170 RepID=UPI003D6A6635
MVGMLGMMSLSFNVNVPDGRLLCPVCGFPEYSDQPAYSERGGEIGTTICPCCLWEPGFDDTPLASAKAEDTILESIIAYRARWSVTKQWQGQRQLLSEGFDGEGQLTKLASIAPHLL